nr:hypothetical protein [uncultured Pseudodesulfovibrio sp.]
MTNTKHISELQSYLNEAQLRLRDKDDAYFEGCLSIKKKSKRCRTALKKYKELFDKSDSSIKFLYLALQHTNTGINESYKSNIFKPSSFDFKYPEQIYKHLFALYKSNFIHRKVSQYIKSVMAIIKFSSIALVAYSKIKNTIETDNVSFLKSVLAYADVFFLNKANWKLSNGHQVTTEEIAESCSYIASIFYDTSEVLPSINGDIDEYKLEEHFNVIIFSHILKQYIYAEIVIGKLPYVAHLDDKSLIIKPIDPEYEKCRVCGYTNHQIQSFKVHSAIVNNLDINNDFHHQLELHKEELSNSLVIRTSKNGPERLVFGLPEDNSLIMAFHGYFNRDSISTDEASLIAYTCSQYHIKADALYNFKINGQITVLDVIKLRRFFVFIGTIFGHALLKEAHSPSFPPPALVMRSIIPYFEKKDIHRLLGLFFDESIIESFIKTFSFDPIKDSFFDIQYKPITDLGNFYYCNVQSLICSDLIRNSLVYHKQRFFEDNVNEPLVLNLYNSLLKVNSLTKSNYFIGTQEVDCISIFDNYIFIFEVKNNFLPCNYAEERTTYDHIKKSSKQLFRAVEELSKTKHQQRIETDFGITNIASKKIFTCTILGNRVFTGYKIEGHPIRYSGEIENFLETGVSVKDGKEYNMWAGDTLCEEDLAWFVESGGTNISMAPLCESQNNTYNLGEFAISFSTFTLPPERIFHTDFLKALEEANT